MTGSREIALGAVVWLLTTTAPLAAASTETGPKAIAIVNGETVTTEALETTLESLHGGVEQVQRSAADVDRLIFKVINDVLIGQEARSLGLHLEPPIPQTLESARQSMALAKLRAEEIVDHSQVTDEEVTQLFEDQYRRATFRVLTSSDLEGAEELLAELREGADFEALATERSMDPYRLRGGLLEDLLRKDLQAAISAVVFNLSPGELAGPVRTDLGWSVLLAISFQDPDPELFPKVQRTLAAVVKQRKTAAARDDLARRLRDRHPVWLDQQRIASIQPVRRPDGRWTAHSSEPDHPVARIGETFVVTEQEYAVALDSRWKGIPNVEAAKAAAPIILNNLITEQLLVAEAFARGYDRLPLVERALKAQETQLLVPRYLNKVLAAGIEVSEDEKKAFFEENKNRYRRPPRVRLGQITVATEEEAQSIAQALRGGTDLAWLAQRRSIDGLKEKGGVQDWSVVQPNTGSFNATLLEAQPGDVLEPVQEEDSWVVFKVVAREERGIYGYDEISGNLREAVFRQKFAGVLDSFIKTLRSRSQIEVREDVLAELRIGGTAQEESDSKNESHSHD